MLGKTHMMVGIAATLAITHPDTLSGFVTAAGIGAIGALISDIDVGTSSSHRDANRVIFLTIAVAVIFLAVDYFGKFGRPFCKTAALCEFSLALPSFWWSVHSERKHRTVRLCIPLRHWQHWTLPCA